MTIYRGKRAEALLNSVDATEIGRKVGRTTEYIAWRIKNEHPEVAAKIASYGSVWGAAVACGIVKPRGSTARYLKERMRREHPDTFAQLSRYPSVHAAAVACGLIKPRVAGNSPAYIEARLKRDFPEIYARLAEFPSVRAAGIAAGIVRPPARKRNDTKVDDRLRREWLSSRIEHLSIALARAADCVERQRAIVAALESNGRQTEIARSLLDTFERMNLIVIAHRERLIAMLAGREPRAATLSGPQRKGGRNPWGSGQDNREASRLGDVRA